MVAKNKAATGKGQTKKLELKSETIRNLEVTKISEVKGGRKGTGNIATKWTVKGG